MTNRETLLEQLPKDETFIELAEGWLRMFRTELTVDFCIKKYIGNKIEVASIETLKYYIFYKVFIAVLFKRIEESLSASTWTSEIGVEDYTFTAYSHITTITNEGPTVCVNFNAQDVHQTGAGTTHTKAPIGVYLIIRSKFTTVMDKYLQRLQQQGTSYKELPVRVILGADNYTDADYELKALEFTPERLLAMIKDLPKSKHNNSDKNTIIGW